MNIKNYKFEELDALLEEEVQFHKNLGILEKEFPKGE